MLKLRIGCVVDPATAGMIEHGGSQINTCTPALSPMQFQAKTYLPTMEGFSVGRAACGTRQLCVSSAEILQDVPITYIPQACRHFISVHSLPCLFAYCSQSPAALSRSCKHHLLVEVAVQGKQPQP